MESTSSCLSFALTVPSQMSTFVALVAYAFALWLVRALVSLIGLRVLTMDYNNLPWDNKTESSSSSRKQRSSKSSWLFITGHLKAWETISWASGRLMRVSATSWSDIKAASIEDSCVMNDISLHEEGLHCTPKLEFQIESCPMRVTAHITGSPAFRAYLKSNCHSQDSQKDLPGDCRTKKE